MKSLDFIAWLAQNDFTVYREMTKPVTRRAKSFFAVAGMRVEPTSGAYGAPRKTLPSPPAIIIV